MHSSVTCHVTANHRLSNYRPATARRRRTTNHVTAGRRYTTLSVFNPRIFLVTFCANISDELRSPRTVRSVNYDRPRVDQPDGRPVDNDRVGGGGDVGGKTATESSSAVRQTHTSTTRDFCYCCGCSCVRPPPLQGARSLRVARLGDISPIGLLFEAAGCRN